MTRRSTAALALLALALSACSATVGNLIPQYYRPGIQSSFAYGGGGRDMTVIVHGNPFSLPKAEVDQIVVDAMQGQNAPPPTHFTTTPSANARPNYRVVTLFNPPLSQSSSALCGDPSRLVSTPRGDGRLRLLTAFCVSENLMSDVASNLPSVTSPRDPAFRSMIARATFALIPLNDPYDSGDRCRLPVC